MKPVYKIFEKFVGATSCEFFITRFKWPNGGTVIFLRSFLICLEVSSLYTILKHSLDPTRIFEFSLTELRTEATSSLQVYGTIFGAIYLALYARFSSQWNYLANLYNQIKQAELLKTKNEKALIEWKVGFIEDAIALHLARRPMFAVAISIWIKEKKVRSVFHKTVHNGEKALKHLCEDIDQVLKNQ